MVAAQGANLHPGGDLLAAEVETPETRRAVSGVGQRQRSPDGAGQVAKARNVDGFSEALLESGNQRPVPGGGALEADDATDVLFHRYAAEIVLGDAVQHGGQDLVEGVPLAEKLVDVPFHEHGTAVAGQRGRGVQGPGGVFGKRAVQSLGLLFDETARSGRADRVHDAKVHAAVLEGGEFGVLAADFNDGVHVGLKFAGRAGMRGDFVQYQVGPEDASGQFAPGPGDGGADDRQRRRPSANGILDRCQQALDGADRVSGGAGVKAGRDVPAGVTTASLVLVEPTSSPSRHGPGAPPPQPAKSSTSTGFSRSASVRVNW